MVMIQINNLQKKFGAKTAVNIDNYIINQGDMLGLVGNNGAGKTTLFRLILDLLQADRGNVTINDIDVCKSEDWKNFTGAFIDDGFLIDYLTPEEYFHFIGKMYGLKKEEVDERIAGVYMDDGSHSGARRNTGGDPRSGCGNVAGLS